MKKKRNVVFPLRRKWMKIPLRMNLTLLLLVSAIVQGFSIVNAQTVDLKKQDASLEEIIWELKEKTSFVFLYSSEDIADVKGINIDVQNLQIEAILTQCLKIQVWNVFKETMPLSSGGQKMFRKFRKSRQES